MSSAANSKQYKNINISTWDTRQLSTRVGFFLAQQSHCRFPEAPQPESTFQHIVCPWELYCWILLYVILATVIATACNCHESNTKLQTICTCNHRQHVLSLVCHMQSSIKDNLHMQSSNQSAYATPHLQPALRSNQPPRSVQLRQPVPSPSRNILSHLWPPGWPHIHAENHQASSCWS